MRKVVMRMMTTLNGRLDDPDAWVTGVPDDLYAELDRLYETFDTILVGRTTYEEMFAYWRLPLLRAPRRVIHVARAQTSKLERPA
jgi:dihydrofolate reductase